MICPKCFGKKIFIGLNTKQQEFLCSSCGHKFTQREYEAIIPEIIRKEEENE